MKTLVIFVSTFWGTRHGGVNALNFQLCTAFAKSYPLERVLSASIQSITTSLKTPSNLSFYSVLGAERHPNEHEAWSPEEEIALFDHICETHNDDDFSRFIIIGHDVYTGPTAQSLVERLRSHLKAKCDLVLFQHVDPQLYKSIEVRISSDRVQQDSQKQLALLRQADAVFAVGPILYRTTRTRLPEHKIFQFIPGMTSLDLTLPTDSICIAAVGRFDQEHDVVKQSSLVHQTYAAIMKIEESWVREPRWRESTLLLIGAEQDKRDSIRNSIIEHAGMSLKLQVLPYYDSPDVIGEIYKTAGVNIGVVPSLHESFGLVAWEFIGAGIPLILSKRTGVFEWLESQYHDCLGLITPLDVRGSPSEVPHEHDVRQLFAALKDVGQNLQTKIADATALKARTRFPWDTAAKQVGAALHIGQREVASPSFGTLTRFEANLPAMEERLVERRELELFDSLRGALRLGRYKSAQLSKNALESLRPDRSLGDQVLPFFAEVELKTGNYDKAIELINNNMSEQRALTEAVVSFETFRYEGVRNVVLRDRGHYDLAAKHSAQLVRWANTWMKTLDAAPEVTVREANARLSSALRKQARSLAFVSESEQAQLVIKQSFELADGSLDRGKCSFAEAEVLRHGGLWEESLGSYFDAIGLAQDGGDLDLHTWSALGLSDSFLLLARPAEAKRALGLAQRSLEVFQEEAPIEKAHIAISRASISKFSSSDRELDSAVSDLSARGVSWPKNYYLLFRQNGAPPFPKRF